MADVSLAGILAMPFFSRALVALIGTGLAFPHLGAFILSLELVPARFAVMHAALLGAAVALILHLDPSLMAMLASVAAGVGIAIAGWKSRLSAGGSLALVMTVSLGLSFVIFYKSNVQAATAFNLFWGNILSLNDGDLRLIILISAGILLFLACAWKEIQIVLYDRDLARAVGVPAKLVYGGIILSVCLGVAAAMRITGALLVDAVTMLPALAARKLGRSFRGILVLGAVFGLGMNLAGFAASFVFDIPVSSAIILAGALTLLVTGGRKHGKA